MAYAFRFPRDVTDIIYQMRDWRWEMIRAGGKTPSARCFNVNPGLWDIEAARARPTICAETLPYYYIESDSEEKDFGKPVCGPLLVNPKSEITIDIYNPAKFFRLRDWAGETPEKLRRLQKHDESRIKETWFQCEPCEGCT